MRTGRGRVLLSSVIGGIERRFKFGSGLSDVGLDVASGGGGEDVWLKL